VTMTKRKATGHRVRIRLNGKEREVGPGLTVAALLEELEVHPGMVVVEHNREILPRQRYGDASVVEGDQIELVHFVGGG
jgi:thiamine biosynthesis protein ThiS